MRYLAAQTLDDAVAALAQSGGAGVTVVAGGTDVFPALGERAFEGALLDVSKTAGMGGVEETEAGWRLGGALRWSELLAAPLPPLFDGLKAAAREVGSVQIQNAGTLAGNLCNASPAADGVPPLLAMDASVELASARGARRLPLSAFLLGVRKTALAPDELLAAIHVPRKRAGTRSAFVKLGARRYLVISICMVAVVLEPEIGGAVGSAGVAVGACSAVAQRAPGLEAALVGAAMTRQALCARAEAGDLAHLTPIDDVRGSAAYRRSAALELTRRALSAAAPA